MRRPFCSSSPSIDPFPLVTPAPLVIRPATPADVDALLEMIRGLAEFEHLSHQVEATAERLAHALFGPRPAAEAVLAEADGDVVGFALFFTNFSTFLAQPGLYLEDLFVKPDHRGRGYGKALLAHLAELAVTRNYGRFEWSVLDWNQPAIEFYRSQGAEVLPDWRICRVTGAPLRQLGAKGSG